MTVCPESFFKTLKREEVYLHDYRTFEGPLPPTLGPSPSAVLTMRSAISARSRGRR